MVLDIAIEGLVLNQVIGSTILSSPFFVNSILPFILIFTVLFAILQKTEILGGGKRQIDSIVSLVIALIVISFANAVGIITALLPVLAVTAVVILVFMILYGMVFKEKEFEMGTGLKITFGILIGIVVIIAVLVSTGAWDYLYDLFLFGGSGGEIVGNVIFLVIIAGAVAVVISPWGGKGKDKE